MSPERFAFLQDAARPVFWTGLSGTAQHAFYKELLVALADANEKIRNQAETIDALRREKEGA